MKTLIVYDSWFENTKQIAEAIAGETGRGTTVLPAHDEHAREAVEEADVVVVGSPTHGGVTTPAIQEFLNSLPEDALMHKRVTAFDTRVPARFVKLFGFAANRIEHKLRKKGGTQTLPPQGFYVQGKEGPLKDGELERAKSWGKQLAAAS